MAKLNITLDRIEDKKAKGLAGKYKLGNNKGLARNVAPALRSFLAVDPVDIIAVSGLVLT